MLELKVKCERTKLRLISQPAPFTEGLKNYAKIVFDFHDDWSGLTKTATFKRVIDQHSVTISITDNECVVPYEVFVYPQVELSVRGSNSEKVITSNILRIDVKRSINEGAAPEPSTPDVYDSILEAAEEAVEAANSVVERANSGEFKGEKGDKGDDGTSITILGAYDTAEELISAHPTGELGQGYIIDGDLYIWNGSAWQNVGKIQGDPGQDGEDGITPTIGENGNWFLGDVDTGKPSRGVAGTPGQDGVDGTDGADGAAATISEVTVTTGEPGTQASVENTGTSTDAKLHFTIPRGIQGEKGEGVPEGGSVGQVLTKTAEGTEWKSPEATGDYLPLTGGELSGNVAVSTGTTEPNVTLKRTVDSAACELTARIDSEAKAGLRYKVGTDTVNELILEQNQTRLRKPLDVASGGVPTTGTTGQVLTKTADGHTWQDLPDIVEPTADELREILNTPVLEETSGKAVLKTPDASTTAILDIASGGTGANNAADAANNLKTYTLLGGIEIPKNSDLNDYKTAGNYIVTDSNVAKTLINTPYTVSGFSMKVVLYTGAYGYQEIVTRKGHVYYREINNYQITGDWVEIPNETDLANYLPLTGGKLTGAIAIDSGSVAPYIRLDRTINGDKYQAQYTVDNTGYPYIRLYLPDGTYKNLAEFSSDKTSFPNAPVNITSGGTGANSAKAAQHNLLSGMNSATDTPNDSSKLVFAYDASTSNNGAIFKRPLSSLWTWIKGKADSIYAAVNHTHAMSDITGLPLETIYTNSNQSLSGTTSKVLNVYKFCGIALVDVYVYVASFTKPSSYTEKTVLTLNLPSGVKLEPSGIEGYPSLRIWNDLCITDNVTESATGTPSVNSAGTAIVFKGFFGGGGSTKAQAWHMLFTATLQEQFNRKGDLIERFYRFTTILD